MLPLLPITMEEIPLGVLRQPPAMGEATAELLREISVGAEEEAALRAKGGRWGSSGKQLS
jgi:crotonobetainyl-CoA:carnitine CoA-transferase CaiB-like acyl-CoA transferase